MYKQYKDSYYDIYDDGRCYSHKTKQFMTPQMSSKYPTYNLSLGDKKRKVKVHRMVAETFLDNPDNKPYVNHIDGDTHNFHVSNLEWVTASENNIHAAETGLRSIGSQKPNYEPQEGSTDWMPVVGYPNYIISNIGEVQNISTKRILKPALNPRGYYEVNLWKNNKGTTLQIHRLVYISFSGDNNLNGYVINHIDGNKQNNNYLNLEKVTYQENNLHAEYVIKTHSSAKAVIQLDEEKNVIKEYPSIAQAFRETDINNIGRAIKEGTRAGGFYWRFK